MKFENTELEGKVIPFTVLDHLMEANGFARGGHWDYERVTYDFKFENMTTGDIFYLRVPCLAVEGEVEAPGAMIKLLAPYLGKYYYPHGVEYDEEFPSSVVKTCNEKLTTITQELEEAAV